MRKAVGCGWCGGSVYRGRIGVFELMVVADRMKEMVLRRASTGEIRRVAEEEEGMIRPRGDGSSRRPRMKTVEEVLRNVV